MSKKLLYIILLISLAFNLAFIGSFVYMKCQYHRDYFSMRDHERPGMMQVCPPSGQPGEDMQSCRPAPPPPQDMLPPLGNQQALKPFRDKFVQSKMEFLQALQQPKVDEAKLNKILESSLKNHYDLEREIGQKLIKLRKTMTAEQANAFFGKQINRAKMQQNHMKQNRKRRFE